MYKDLCSALLMTVITILFAIPMNELSGESREVPQLLIIIMAIINVAQYIQAFIKMANKIDVRISVKGYPGTRVGLLFGLTVVYLFSLQPAGFYLSSLAYFFITSLFMGRAAIAIMFFLIAVIVFCTHIGNIGRLLNGTEKPFYGNQKDESAPFGSSAAQPKKRNLK